MIGRIIAFIITMYVFYYIFDEDLLIALSNISSVLFFAFATTSMISISALVAIEVAKKINYKILSNELEELKDELHSHITRNSFSIDINEEAKQKYDEYKNRKEQISELKGEDYES